MRLSAEELSGREVAQRGQRLDRDMLLSWYAILSLVSCTGHSCWSAAASALLSVFRKKDLVFMQKSSLQTLLTVVIFLEMSCGSWHRFWVQEFGKARQYQYGNDTYFSIHRCCCCYRDKIHSVINDPAIFPCLAS